MGIHSEQNDDENADLMRRVSEGDENALDQLFSVHRDRLLRMIRLRLDRRIQGRVDSTDILQEAYLDVFKNLGEYIESPSTSFFIWLRNVVGLKLAEVHRRHLAIQKRDVRRDISIYRGALPALNSVSLAAQLLGQLTTPSQTAMKTEMRIRLQEVLDCMDEIDCEVIAMRHFEQLNSQEVADVLGMSKSGASSRYIRAIQRLKEELSQFSEFGDLA
jgi:RNA polymerase sigma-70 factor (ECF subfamily)